MGAKGSTASAVTGMFFLLAAGCASLKGPAATKAPSADPVAISQALAHFAQGLIFEWQDPPDLEAALRSHREAARLDPNDPELRLMVARLLVDLDRSGEALEWLGAAVHGIPESFELREAQARVAMVCERYGEAARGFLAAADLAETPRVRIKALGAAAYAFFRQDADAEVLEALGRMASEPVPEDTLANPEAEEGSEEGEGEGVPDPDPNLAPRLRAIRFSLELAEARLGAGSNTTAVAHSYALWAERRSESDAERADVWEAFGASALRVRRRDMAAEALRRAASFDPLRTPAAVTALSLALGIPSRKVTLESVLSALGDDPGNAALHVSAARFLIEAERPEDAIPHVEAASRHWLAGEAPKVRPPEFWLFHGSLLERAGRLDASERVFRQALQEHPAYPPIQNYLAYMFAEQSRELEEAERLVRAALEQEPDNTAYLDTLGWVYFRMGRMEEALVWLLRAAGGEPKDAVIFDHLGDVLARLGRKDEARVHWTMSLHLDPANAAVSAKLAPAP